MYTLSQCKFIYLHSTNLYKLLNMDNEDDLFEAAMADVTPLKEGRSKFGAQKPALPEDFLQSNSNFSGPQPSLPLPEEQVVVHSNSAQCLSGKVPSLDMKTFNQLAKGVQKPQAHLDLHGYFEGDAWLATMDYIHEAFYAGMRCVMIIHGKGKGYGIDKDMGIIKAQMASWLAHHPRVMAFHTAIPKDGGTGALYVYLYRNRGV